MPQISLQDQYRRAIRAEENVENAMLEEKQKIVGSNKGGEKGYDFELEPRRNINEPL